jgi:hypothetical protein
MSQFDNLRKLLKVRPADRGEDPQRSTLWTTPWAWRDEDGCYVGWNGDVWLYRTMPLFPIAAEWEDPSRRLEQGRHIQQALVDIGQMSKESVTGLRQLASNREVHLLAITSEAEARPPEGTPEDLGIFLEDTLTFLVPTKTMLIGVKLREANAMQAGGDGLIDGLKKAVAKPLGEEVPDMDRFAADRQAVGAVLGRSGGKQPTKSDMRLLESWYNLGRGTDAVIIEQRDRLVVDQTDAIEMAVVHAFHDKVNYAPYFQWVSEAEAHPEGIRVVSVRAELEPAQVARRRARQSQRRIRAQIDEEAATQDIDRPEYSDTYQLAAAVEDHFLNTNEPLLTNCSIVLARRASDADETYIDFLRNNHAIEVRPLPLRQLDALNETLPTSPKRVNPFLHDLTIGMLAFAGMHGFSALGDRNGVYLGLTLPNYTPTFLGPLEAPRRNMPPSMGIFGDPGSGKALANDEVVATPSGWRAIGTLAVGDLVIGADGQPTEVTEVHPQGRRRLAKVVFDDGSVVRADDDHLWVVRHERAGHISGELTVTTAELAERLTERDGRWSVPMVGAVHYQGPSVDVAGAISALRDGTDPHAAFAPVEDRRGVVAGVARAGELIAGVAWVDGLSHASAEALRVLVESLGGTVRDGGGAETLTLGLHLDRATFEAAFATTTGWKAPARYVVAVRPDGTDEATCIRVAASDHLFVTAHHVVTHNTYLCQLIAYQAALSGLPVIFINPKGYDTLSPLAELAGGRVVSMSRLESATGAFDPCRYVATDRPELSAEIATNHILSVLTGFTEQEELQLSYGLLQGMRAGAQCVRDALAYVENSETVRRVLQQAQTSPTFALGLGVQAQPRIDVDRSLTLIEFDRKLDLPESGKDPASYSRAERISLAAIRLVTRASLEILANFGGGVLVLDEAWTFLSSQAGLSALQQLGREGRSLNILPIFATQRIADLIGHDMESYMSRVMVMSLRDPAEARAALQLCGLEATAGRLDWLKSCGPRQQSEDTPDGWAMGLHRDLDNRHAAVLIGPTPNWVDRAITTNPEERKRIREERAGDLGLGGTVT